MNDMFEQAPIGYPPVIRNGKIYSLHERILDKEPRWVIRWVTEDGTRSGSVGGWYITPDLAYAAIDMVSTLRG